MDSPRLQKARPLMVMLAAWKLANTKAGKKAINMAAAAALKRLQRKKTTVQKKKKKSAITKKSR
jgi:hypothetical protein